jgi:hypothetical protein
MKLSRAALWAALTVATACAAPVEPHPVYAGINVKQITLPEATYLEVPQYASFILENQGASTLYVTLADPEGDGGDLLVVDLQAFSELLPGQRMPLEVTLDPRTWLWDTGTYAPKVLLEVRYFFSGQTKEEPETPSTTEAPKPVADVVDLTVNYTIDCDLDDDGFDAIACGGEDCDDRFDNVHPGADELCDGADQDCDGGVDEEAVDRPTWYADNDRDAFGDAEVSVLSCLRPDSYWADNGEDCDDDSLVNHPEADELCDGDDNDCDDEVDEGCD